MGTLDQTDVRNFLEALGAANPEDEDVSILVLFLGWVLLLVIFVVGIALEEALGTAHRGYATMAVLGVVWATMVVASLATKSDHLKWIDVPDLVINAGLASALVIRFWRKGS